MPNLIQPPGQNFASNVTSINCDLPVYGGDPASVIYLLIVSYSKRDATVAATAPAGYDLENTSSHSIGSLSVVNFYQSIYTKPYDGSLGVSVAFSVPCNATIEAFICTDASPNSPDPVTILGTSDITDLTSHAAPSITTALDNSLIVGIWTQPSPDGVFIAPASMNTDFSQAAGDSGPNASPAAVLIASENKASAGVTGTRTATSRVGATGPAYQINSIATLLAINPSQKPSAPGISNPVSGRSYTKGVPLGIELTPATSPVVAQSALVYKIEYSANNANDPWTVITTTAPGVLTATWTTSGLAIGSGYHLRAAASSDGGATFGPYFTMPSSFAIVADVSPGKPTNLQPATIPINRAEDCDFSYIFNDTGDRQTKRTWEYGTDGTSFPSGPGEVTTADTSFTVAGGTFSRGTVYHRVKVKDFAGNTSPYSDVVSFFAGDKPATPNITSPTAGSPPTTSRPTITWTSVGQIAYRLRIFQGASLVYNGDDGLGGYTVSTALAATCPVSLANGLSYTILLSIKNVDGLASDEDSETFTPLYATPGVPTLEVTALSDDGLFQLAIGNTGSAASNDIFQYDASQSEAEAIKIAEGLGLNAVFKASNVKSGVQYFFFARAYDATGTLIADSLHQSGTLTLALFFLHAVTKTSTTGNASISVSLRNLIPESVPETQSRAVKKYEGRPKPAVVFGQVGSRQIRARIFIEQENFSKVALVEQIHALNTVVCARDQKSNLLFGRLTVIPLSKTTHSIEFELVIDEDGTYVEAIT